MPFYWPPRPFYKTFARRTPNSPCKKWASPLKQSHVALYRKVLRLSPKGLQAESTGRIVTLMSNDVNKLQELFAMIHNLWAAPIFIVASFVLLY